MTNPEVICRSTFTGIFFVISTPQHLMFLIPNYFITLPLYILNFENISIAVELKRTYVIIHD
jgi:hypothetical protein